MVQTVSAAVKAAFSASPIKRKYKLLIDWLTSIDQSGTITADEFDTTYFPKTQAIDGRTFVKDKPFILSTQNYLRATTADDNLYLASNLYENGWMGDSLSDVNGDLVENWQIIYTAAQSINTITVTGSQYNYPIDFDLYYRDAADANWVLCDNYTGQTATSTAYALAALTSIKGIKVEITKISAKNMYACLAEVSIGFSDDVTCDLVDMNINKELEYMTGTPAAGSISANSFSCRLKNTAQRYNTKNTLSPIYTYLKSNKKVTPYIGVQVGADITYIQQGVFYTKDIVPNPQMIAEIRCVDQMALMKEKDFTSSTVYEGNTISEMVEVIVKDYGLEPEDYNIDATTDTIPYMFFNPASYAYIIKLLVIAEGGMAFFDELGIFQFKNRDWAPGATIDKAYTDANIIRGTFDSPYIAGMMKNRIKIKSRPLYESELKNIYTLESAITIPAGETKSIPCYFIESPCLDVANAVVVKHVDITQDSEARYGYATFLTFTNANIAAQDVTAITIDGKPLVEKGVTLADEKDDAYITEYAEKLMEINNPYIQDYSYAVELAADLLTYWKDPDIESDFKALSMPWLQLGDRASLTSTKFNLTAVENRIFAINIKCGKSIIDTIKTRKIV